MAKPAPLLKGASRAQISAPPSRVGLTGRPLNIVNVVDNCLELDEENLRALLERPEVKDKPVVVVSVAGAFRKGKSFLLDFFIRYLSYVGKNGHDEDWLADEEMPLVGFPWRGGAERETQGILIWSEPFVVPSTSGEDVVVLLLDTQGAFDTESTVKECATIFALSTMVSSVQVYNLHSNIGEDALQHLQLFTEYGRLAVNESHATKPFQSLLFLVRDWSFPYDHEYGLNGGNELLEKRLQILPNQAEELQMLREQIRSCFETIDCFLMPHPGLRVATNPHYDGKLRDIEPDFKANLKDLVPQLLSKENLIMKEICGTTITTTDLIEYFRVYMKIFQGDDLPKPVSLMQATAEANNLVALTHAKEVYTSRMDACAGGDRPYLNPDQLTESHHNFKQQAVEAFHSVKKMGGEEFSIQYLEMLDSHIQESWEQYEKANAAKSMLHSMKTPITLFSCFVLFYMLSGVMAAIGITSFTSFFNMLVLLSLILLSAWAYCRQTGELRELGTSIDTIADTIWTLVRSMGRRDRWLFGDRSSSPLVISGPTGQLIDQGVNRFSLTSALLGTNSTSASGSSPPASSSASSGSTVRQRNVPPSSSS